MPSTLNSDVTSLNGCSSFASSFFSPCSSINESCRKKSGSVSALYLCDTASTKAKKADLKQNQQIGNNLKDFDQHQYQSSSIGYCSSNQNSSNHHVNSQNIQHASINRRNSMGKKASVERSGTLNYQIQAQSFSQPINTITIFNSISSNTALANGSGNECSLKKQQPSVFDRLSRSSKKV